MIKKIISIPVLLILSGCEYNVAVGTSVNADGSLDRVVSFQEVDSSLTESNIMGITRARGWEVIATPVESENNRNDNSKNIRFKRHFPSADSANAEMDRNVDTLFHIHSSFKKKTGIFYSYIEYSDTYRALNRFHALSIKEYFTPEDFHFINRLPAEGKPISRSDSLYLARLNEKIYDIYASRTIFEELFDNIISTMKENKVEARWLDTLSMRKEGIYNSFVKDDIIQEQSTSSLMSSPGSEKNVFLKILDKLNVPLPAAGRLTIEQKAKELEDRVKFVSLASIGKYLHTINMPWAIVDSNADSVVNNQLYWRPPVIKFLLNDYTMTATARKLNTWTVVASAAFVLATIILFFTRRRG